MTLAIVLFVLYAIIGASLMPMFTRASFKALNKEFRQAYAQKKCGMAGFEKSLIWPIAIAMHISTRSINREIEAAEKKEKERKETERILREFEENDPVTKEFKRLEEEERQKEIKAKNNQWARDVQQLSEDVKRLPKQLKAEAVIAVKEKRAAGMVLDSKGIWDYPNELDCDCSDCQEDRFVVRNYTGEVLREKPAIDKDHQLKKVHALYDQNDYLYSEGFITAQEYAQVNIFCEEEVKRLSGD